jgi:hypothetical protein
MMVTSLNYDERLQLYYKRFRNFKIKIKQHPKKKKLRGWFLQESIIEKLNRRRKHACLS